MVGERAHVEVVHGEVLGGMPSSVVACAHLARERVGREPLRQRARRDRERDVAHVGALLDEPRHRRAAPELAVVGVRREYERPLHVADHPAGLRVRGAPRTGDHDEREERPEDRVLEEGVVEEAVHDDRDQG